nr:hypothetical protein [Tanacetum cinerariifolium]
NGEKVAERGLKKIKQITELNLALRRLQTSKAGGV